MLKWSQFIIKDDKLFLKKLNLEVIPDDERESKMKELYENNVTGVSRGVGAGAWIPYKRGDDDVGWFTCYRHS